MDDELQPEGLSRMDLVELTIDRHIPELREEVLATGMTPLQVYRLADEEPDVKLVTTEALSCFVRAAYAKGFADRAQRRGPSAAELRKLGYRIDLSPLNEGPGD